MVAHFKKSKKKSRKTLFSYFLIGFLTLLMIGFLVVSNWKINQRRAELTAKIESLKKEIQIIEEKNKQLQAGINQTKSETYLEEKAREQGYKKPGEETIVVLPPEETEKQTETTKNFWQKILEKLGF